ncbi:MAG: hypothetical protein ACLFPO_10190 [Spirochaetaceae bacterium]
MKTKLLILASMILFAGSTAGFAQTADLSIRYYDKSIYFPGDDIIVKMMIKNESPETYRFRLAENRMFNINFDVRTLANTQLDASEEFSRERASNQQVFYREVTLAPGEEYAFTENVADYVDIPGAGMYVVRARFFPDLVTSDEADSIDSDRLMLSVRPPATGTDAVEAAVDAETGEVLRRVDMPPDEIVDYMLTARQRGQWNRFLLYLDVESILRANPARERRYLRLSEEDRRREVQEFREQLQQQTVEDTINVVPDDYEIVRTTYTPTEAQVVALLRFRYDTFTEIKEYTYFLQRENSYWEIDDYNVTNVGTE